MTALTPSGLEEVSAAELQQLGASEMHTQNRSVRFKGDQSVLYRANLHMRTALRILKPIHRFLAMNERALYRGVRAVDWSDYLDVDDTLAIDSVVNSKYITHSKYAALKSKDAIVDQFRERTGRRPSVDVAAPTLRIHLHISGKYATVSLDSSGDSLHRRGYRLARQQAPINEALAAGLILLSGWKGDSDLIDPMCGSGTFLIEAAMLASKTPPGHLRQRFGFQSWKDFDRTLWQTVRTAAMAKIVKCPVGIFGSDKSEHALKIARENIVRAGFDGTIKLSQQRFEALQPRSSAGLLIMNPPYGERLNKDDVVQLYAAIGDKLKQSFSGFEAWILSANKEALKHVGLRPSKKYTVYNGGLECKFQKYALYAGSKKAKHQPH